MRLLVLPLVCLFILFAGCNDDDDVTFRTTSPDMITRPTLSNIWPNQDQTSWTFDYVWSLDAAGWTNTFYDSLDAVPPVPDWSDIEDYLNTDISADSLVTVASVYRMRFNGERRAGGGVTAQNLEESFSSTGAGPVAVPATSSGGRGFLARLYLARPDLAEQLMLFGDTPAAAAEEPMFVHGGVWEKTAEWIGTYGDIDQHLAWKFLTSNLRPGTEFSHQLLPSIADDLWLYGRIKRVFNAGTDVGVLRNSLECYYIIDYGISHFTTPSGGSLGYTRSIGYGVVVYAPTVGPVYCHERGLADIGIPVGYSELKIRLTASSTLPQ
jgi:hypothetical protein